MQKTLLIADDDTDVLDLLTRRCQSLGFAVETASNAMDALKQIEASRPDAVILDVEMPDGNGLTVCEMMASHAELSAIPVVMLTANSEEETVRRCHQLCAFYVLKCTDMWPRIEPILREIIVSKEKSRCGDATENIPSDCTGPTELMDTVFAILGAESDNSFASPGESDQLSEEPWVLSIEDDDDIALALRLRLQEVGVQVIRASAGGEGYRRAFLDAPRAILLDYELPGGNGDYVLRRLKENPATRDIPVIVLTGRRESSIERQMRNLGASEFLTKPFDWRRLREVLEVHLQKPIAATAD